MVGLVSEKSILIQYGYMDPEDFVRYKPNCDQDGVWIYAALAALGRGGGNSLIDGVFSFEYQQPHPSVPAVRLGTSSYAWYWIDLHRRKYPQMPQYPWPGNVDYPWYNPLWPEGNPTLERGTVHLWGSVLSTRAGQMSREYSDPQIHNPNQIWNVPVGFCGGPAGNSYPDPVLNVTFACENAPGTTGNKIGYKRDYHYDKRLETSVPPDFPTLSNFNNVRAYTGNKVVYKKPPRNLTLLN
jgi:hypothetical protein